MTLIPSKFRTSTAILLALIATAISPMLHAQALSGGGILDDGGMPDEEEESVQLIGAINGNQYLSPTGAFRVNIPVLAELGGDINDTTNVVTFQDAYGHHASIGCFPINEKLRAEETKRGRKEFLVWFFQNYIQADFMRSIPGTTAEPNARYISTTQGGALLTQLLLPDGSVFSERVFVFAPKPPPVAKRGNLVFINGNSVYVLSVELSERIFEHSSYNKTVADEEELLRRRLFDLLAQITFTATGSTPATESGTNIAPVKIVPTPAASSTNSSLPTISYPGTK